MSTAELECSVIAEERSDPEQGEVLRGWFDGHVLAVFAERVLPFDLAAARVLAAFRVPEHAPLDDAVTAAIAQANHAIVVTRDLQQFEPLGVSCPKPLESWLTVGGATELPAFQRSEEVRPLRMAGAATTTSR